MPVGSIRPVYPQNAPLTDPRTRAILEGLLQRFALKTPRYGSIEAARLPAPPSVLATAEQFARGAPPGPGEAGGANIGGGTGMSFTGSPPARFGAPALATSTVGARQEPGVEPPPIHMPSPGVPRGPQLPVPPGPQGPIAASAPPAPTGTGALGSIILQNMLRQGMDRGRPESAEPPETNIGIGREGPSAPSRAYG